MMYRTVIALSATLLMGVSGAALAQQAEHDAHRPGPLQAQEDRAPAPMSPSDPDATNFTKAYVDAMDEMHGPMMEGVMAEDPDVAFVRGMIPHHQGAVEMAEVAQQYGTDPWITMFAQAIITAQQTEIREMQAWLSRKQAVAE